MIFVHIASYRDPECRPTITDLLKKAKQPHDLRIVVTLQSEDTDQQHFYHDQLTTISLSYRNSQGACWARHLGYQLFNNEEYVLQIDSHM